MSRLKAKVGDEVYKFWLRIDTTDKFSDKVIAIIKKVQSKEKTKHHIQLATEKRLIIDPAVFDLIQLELDVSRTCLCSLYAQKKGGELNPLVTNAKMYGSNKDDYDKILRLIRYDN